MSEQCCVRRYKNGRWEDLDDTVSREESFDVEWSWAEQTRSGSTAIWAWPGPDRAALRELALGHVLAECVPPEATHRLQGHVTDSPNGFCVALKTSTALPDPPQIVAPELAPELDPETVLARMKAFMDLPGRWDGTGCFHRAGIWLPRRGEADARLHVVEDIGRHNCLDRLLGFAACRGLSLRGQTLFVTARITASLYTKASRLGFGAIVSRSAVSLHSVEAARRDNVRLMGFCRPREARVTVYS